jgi:opacity protein-like surface antigen
MGGRLAYCVAALTLTASAVCAQQPAQTQTGFYASGLVAGSYADNPAFRTSRVAFQGPRSAATGYNFGGGFRTEVEHHRSFGLSDPVSGSHVEDSSVMLNGLYDIPAGPGLKTFIGAGFGAINRNQQIAGANSNEWDSAYQLRGGLTYDIAKNTIGLLEFRQQGLLAGSTPKLSFKQSGIVLGLKYKLQ